MAATGDKSSDIDFRSNDDAWYGVRLFLHNETLIVNYLGFSEEYDDKFKAGDFKSLEAVGEFEKLFRRSAVQVQDCECSMLVPEMTVCVSYAYSDGVIKFYDAVIKSVISKDHTFNEGEEECKCSFVVSWIHGPMARSLLSTSIGCICVFQPGSAQIDPTLTAFLRMSREKFKFSSYRPKKRTHSSEDDCSMEGGAIIDLEDNEQDIDLGGKSITTQNRREKDNCYFILVENLEKDLASQVIVDFIYKHISITCQAYMFPSLLSDTYTRGIIVVDSQKKLQKLFGFLLNPDHFIMSSRGRPWVATEEKLKDGTFGNLISRSESQSLPTKFVKLGSRIMIVNRGTKAFEKGKQLTELFMEFAEHLQRLHKRLALEGERILYSSNTS